MGQEFSKKTPSVSVTDGKDCSIQDSSAPFALWDVSVPHLSYDLQQKREYSMDPFEPSEICAALLLIARQDTSDSDLVELATIAIEQDRDSQFTFLSNCLPALKNLSDADGVLARDYDNIRQEINSINYGIREIKFYFPLMFAVRALDNITDRIPTEFSAVFNETLERPKELLAQKIGGLDPGEPRTILSNMYYATLLSFHGYPLPESLLQDRDSNLDELISNSDQFDSSSLELKLLVKSVSVFTKFLKAL